MPRPVRRLTAQIKEKLLEAVADGLSLEEAVARLQVSYEAVQRLRRRSPQFAELFAEHFRYGTAKYEAVLREAALQGKSVRATLAILRVRDPERYRDSLRAEIAPAPNSAASWRELLERIHARRESIPAEADEPPQ